MTNARMPVFFVSHGGGPWPWIDASRERYAKTALEFGRMPNSLPARPKAVLVVTGHWEEPEFTVSTSEHPPMLYDYYNFPEHTYRITYKAPGAPALATRVGELLGRAGITHREDANRGFDHGTFVPLALMYPEADMPIVMLSLKSSYDAAEHIRLGKALAPLRDEGVLIIGSGLTYHNMRGFGRDESTEVSNVFETFLNDVIATPSAAARNDLLEHWERGPSARLAHPREDHLLPLMVVAGAAGEDVGERVFVDHVLKVAMASYRFGAPARLAA